MFNRRGIELFARDYPHDYPEVEAVLMMHAHRLRLPRSRSGCAPRTAGVSSINSSRSAYYMIKVMLALFVGLLRARPGGQAGEARPSPPSAGSEHGVAAPDRLDRRERAALFLPRLRARPPPPAMERYALLWLFAAAVLLGLSVWGGAARRGVAARSGICYAPVGAVRGRLRLHRHAAAALLAGGLAARRPEQDPRPARGASCSAGWTGWSSGGRRATRRPPSSRTSA